MLDLGCGAGRHAFEALRRGAHVVALDRDRAELDQVTAMFAAMTEAGEAAPRAVATAVAGDATAMPFPDGAFDRVIAAEVLEHIRGDQQAMNEIARVLRPGAPFVAVVPNPESMHADYLSYRYLPTGPLTSGDQVTCLIKGADPFEITDHYWTRQDYMRAVRAAGFTILDVLEPVADPTDPFPWLDEKTVAPDLVIHALRR